MEACTGVCPCRSQQAARRVAAAAMALIESRGAAWGEFAAAVSTQAALCHDANEERRHNFATLQKQHAALAKRVAALEARDLLADCIKLFRELDAKLAGLQAAVTAELAGLAKKLAAAKSLR